MSGMRLAGLLWAFNAGAWASGAAYSLGRGDRASAAAFAIFAVATSVLAVLTTRKP